MAKKKILFILHLPDPVHGAAMVGKYIKESKIINNNFDADYINLSTSQNLEEVGKAGLSKITALLKIQLSVLKALLSKNYSLTYLTLTAKGSGFYKDFLVVIFLKIFRKKIIYHFHNKGVATRQDYLLDNILYKIAFAGTRSILLSQYLYPDIKKYVPKENVFFCANGIPSIKNIDTLMLQKTKNGNENSSPSLLFLSNMIIEKGVLVLIEACKILKEKAVNFKCHFVGSWAEISKEDFDNKIHSNNLVGYVYAHGKKYGEEKQAFLNNADIFVFPTFYNNETFGLVITEAMQFALPVVSTPEGGIPDVVINGETGFLVPQQNAVLLAEKIEILIKNQELRTQMGLAGKKRFQQLFTLEKFENRLSDILEEVIAK